MFSQRQNTIYTLFQIYDALLCSCFKYFFSQEIKQLKADLAEEREKSAKLAFLVDEAGVETQGLRNKIAKEMYANVLAEARKFLAFATLILETFMPDSTTLAELVREQLIFTQRIENAPQYTRNGEPAKLFKVHKPNEPNIKVLKMEIKERLGWVSRLVAIFLMHIFK